MASMTKCPACIARAKSEKEDTAKRTNVQKILDDTPALDGRIRAMKEILMNLKGIHVCAGTPVGGVKSCCRLGQMIDGGIAL